MVKIRPGLIGRGDRRDPRICQSSLNLSCGEFKKAGEPQIKAETSNS